MHPAAVAGQVQAVHRALLRSVWPLMPGGLFRGARLPGAYFMLPPCFHVACWRRHYYTGQSSHVPFFRTITSPALSVAAVTVPTGLAVPLVADTSPLHARTADACSHCLIRAIRTSCILTTLGLTGVGVPGITRARHGSTFPCPAICNESEHSQCPRIIPEDN